MKNLTAILFLFLGFSIQGHAQFPENFEFLDHRERGSSIGASHEIGGGILFVSHNRDYPMTTVSIAGADNHLASIMSTRYSSRSRKVYIHENEVHIFLYKLFDYDIFINGFFHISYIDGVVNVDDFTSGFSFEDIPVIEWIDYLEAGKYLLNDGDDLFVFYNDLRTESLIETQGFETFVNSNQSIYLYKEKEIMLLENNELLPVANFTGDEFIFDISIQENNNNLVLCLGKVYLYNHDFSEVISEWDVRPEVWNLQLLHLYDDQTLLALAENEDGTIDFLEYLGGSEVIIENYALEDLNDFRGFYLNEENSIVLAASFAAEFASNLIFRNLKPGVEHNYDRVNLSLDEFVIEEVDKIVDNEYVDEMGNVVYVYRYVLESRVKVTNQGDKPITNFDAYTAYYHLSEPNLSYFDLDNEMLIEPGSSVEIDSTFEGYFWPYNDIQLINSGANYKINSSPNRSIFADLIVDVSKIEFQEINAYPNPTKGIVNIVSDIPYNQFLVYNLSGELKKIVYKAEGIDQVDLSNLDAGMYLLKGLQKDSKLTYWSKIIKH